MIQQSRRKHLFDRYDVAEERVKVVLSVLRGRNLDLRKLLTGRAEFIHVALGCDRIDPWDADPVGVLEYFIGRQLEPSGW